MPAFGPIDPDRLAATEFSTAFRGYDTGEVRALLHQVGEALREAAEREHDLREQLGRAEAHLRELRETSAAQVEEAAEEARREGREMVAEAQRVRERMLGDLARRRRNARQQVEQLMAGRERLLEAFDSARQTIDAATQDMRGALPEARLAAEAAGRRFDQDVAGEEDDVAVAALEDEIEAARLVGLPLVAPGPEPEPESAPPEPGRSEGSLLGERDVREMPPVELGADFEDVRIVPLEAATDEPPEPTAPIEGEGDGDEPAPTEVFEPLPEPVDADPTSDLEVASGAGDDGDAEDAEYGGDDGEAAGERPAEGELVPVEDEDAVASTDEPDEDPPLEGPGPEPGGTDAPIAVAEDADEPASDEEAPEAPPVDPGHLDDLFASLRAARAEAVSDARSVLERGADEEAQDEEAPDEEAPDDEEEVGRPQAVEPEPEPDEPESVSEPEEEAGVEPEPVPEAESPTDVELPPAPEPDELEEAPAVEGHDAKEEATDPSPALSPLEVESSIAAAGERLASALKRVLAVEQNELLDRLRQVGRGRRADEPGVLDDAAALVTRFATAAEGPLAEVAGLAMASAAPGKRARPPAIEPLAIAVATELVEPLHERLTRGFGEAGTDTAEASARARATFREWKTRRVGVVAADGARGAFHAGLLAGVSPSTALVWSLDDEDAACPECADNALAGPVGRGQRFPTGHRHPPAHDGCRCTLVVAEEPSP